jgi:hypothetical protein
LALLAIVLDTGAVLSRVLLTRVLPVVVAIAASAVPLTLAARTPSETSGASRLPDLDQVIPRELVVTRAPRGRGYRMGFDSAVANVGDGPLIISAHRSGTDAPLMDADQLIEQDGASPLVVRNTGRLRYVVSEDHRHWHLLGFDRYELRRAGQRRQVVRDRKTGFCLGDRYALERRLRAAPPEPVYTGRCGLAAPDLLAIQQGISVGYGDDYVANLEGQYLKLTGLRRGRYVLVHRANSDRRLRESNYRNNASSMLIQLRWHGRKPSVEVLKGCANTARCSL